MHKGGILLLRETPETDTFTGVQSQNHRGVGDGKPSSNVREGSGDILEPADVQSEVSPSASLGCDITADKKVVNLTLYRLHRILSNLE